MAFAILVVFPVFLIAFLSNIKLDIGNCMTIQPLERLAVVTPSARCSKKTGLAEA
jgi:hypothetical protein